MTARVLLVEETKSILNKQQPCHNSLTKHCDIMLYKVEYSSPRRKQRVSGINNSLVIIHWQNIVTSCCIGWSTAHHGQDPNSKLSRW